MDDHHVATVFLRKGGTVLLLRRSDEDGFVGRWDAIVGHAAGKHGQVANDPDRAARRAIEAETTLAGVDVTLVRAGDPIEIADLAAERLRVVHPFLFDLATRVATVTPEATAAEWVPPTEIRRRPTVPGLWRSYERIAPTLEAIATDRERGSAALSTSALRVLRDRAGVLADRTGDDDSDDGNANHDDGDGHGSRDGASDADEPWIDGPTSDDAWDELASLARSLRDARPSMVVVRNRVNRAMATADDRSPEAIERTAQRAIERASEADADAAAVASDVLADRASLAGGEDDAGSDHGDGSDGGASTDAGPRLLTLSRSGTVIETVRRLASVSPTIVVAESRPGGEGVGVAEELGSAHSVTVVADAGVASALREHAIDAVLVGADTVFRDGSVLNKVGTRSAAIAAAYEGIPTHVVAASAKISPEHPASADREAQAGSDFSDVDGESAIDVWNPTFDVTPSELVTGICTERGVWTPTEVVTVAEEFAAVSAWDEGEAEAGDEP